MLGIDSVMNPTAIMDGAFNFFNNALNVNASILIGAFAGSMIFVISDATFPMARKMFLFGASFMSGVVAAPFTADFITASMPVSIVARAPVGALVASAIAVRFLMITNNSLSLFIEKFKPRGGRKI